jgi:hypothetical protein
LNIKEEFNMKHTWKKTIAFVMAFGLVTSAMPPSMGMYRAETSRSIVAHARDGEPKELVQGGEYYIGDIIEMPQYVDNTAIVNKYYFRNCDTRDIQIKSGNYTLPEFTYYEDKEENTYVLCSHCSAPLFI